MQTTLFRLSEIPLSVKNIIAAIILALATLGVRGSELPSKVKAVVAAATSNGLLSARDFSMKTLSPDELSQLKKEIQQLDWIAKIPGLESTILSNYPAEIGVHEKSGFSVSVYYSEDKIMLLSCSVPLVNGSQKEQKDMIETMLATTETLVGRNSGVRRWLDAEWKHSWEISAKLFEKKHVDDGEIIRKKKFGPFLVTVWGVVPDIVFLNCVRETN